MVLEDAVQNRLRHRQNTSATDEGAGPTETDSAKTWSGSLDGRYGQQGLKAQWGGRKAAQSPVTVLFAVFFSGGCIDLVSTTPGYTTGL